MTELLSVFLLLVFLVISIFPLTLILSFFFGPPFVPTPQSVVKEMIDLAKIKKGDVVLDLGSGDGRLLITSAKRGAQATGWEINPFLVLWTKILAFANGVSKKVHMQTGNYQNANLKTADIIFIYALPNMMVKMETKIQKETKSATQIFSYKFPFPKLRPVQKTDSGIFIYKIA